MEINSTLQLDRRIGAVNFSFVVCVFLLLFVSPGTSACESGPLRVSSVTNGIAVLLSVPEANIQAQPTWNSSKGEPPLVSPWDAVELVREWVSSEYGANYEANISGITLHKMSHCTDNHHWTYIINFSPVEDGVLIGDFGDIAAVLMNGEVIGGVVQK